MALMNGVREFVADDFDSFAGACSCENCSMPIIREFDEAGLLMVADANGVFVLDSHGDQWALIGTVFTKRLEAELFLGALPANLCLEHPTEPTDLRCFGFVCV